LSISFWPYYKSNPYQDLLYGCAGENYEFTPLDIHGALARQSRASSDEIGIFHLHWLNAIIRPADTASKAEANAKAFLEKLDRFLQRGGLFVWTVHNVVSHDTPHMLLETKLSGQLAERAAIIHVHGRAAIDEVSTVFPINTEKVVIAEHGSYIGAYPDTVTRDDARRGLDLGPNNIAFLLFGQIRPYKGVERLLTELSNVTTFGHGKPVAIIAGKPTGVDHLALRAMADCKFRSILHLERVPDADVQKFMRASDFLVLPFQKILTSGSAILGLSFGLPIIAPKAGLLPELITDGREGFLYDASDPDGLGNCLRRALALPESVRKTMGIAAFHRAAELDWRRGRAELLRAIARQAVGA
jgi:glycosyltransferase involved in cell wall biosynthesis